ncbi:MAG: hypothetical protein KF734_04440 [Saprospiraceae bacterium]|nr:hypothetical protein [Saprospiraceae bacterium]
MLQSFRYFFLCLFLSPMGGIAQEVPRVRNFTPSDYGGQNQNWSLTQSTTDGWMYVGNNGGLYEFDGASWGHFPMPEKQTVRAVAMGRHGEVFCGGFAEFGYWEKDTRGRMRYTSLSHQLRAEHLEKEEIWHILPMQDYVLFQSFSTIYKYDYQKVVVLQPPSSIMFAQAVGGRVWLPVIGRGLFELLPDNTFRFMEGTEVLSDKIVQFLVADGLGGALAGTTNHGIFQINNGSCRAWDSPLNAEFKKYQLNKAVAISGGGWAIGTILNGAYILDASGAVKFHLHRENGLQNNTVLAIHEDRDGNIWLGLDRGIDLVALRDPLTIFTDQTGRIGTVYTAAEHDGRLYIGTNQGVFVRKICPAAGACHAKFQLVEGTQGQVWQLQVFGKQLLCGHNGGTFVIQNDHAQKISDLTGGWCIVQVPGNNAYLLQSTYTGLCVLRKNSKGAWEFSHRVRGFGEPLRRIAFDTAGNVWGAHPNKGLFRLRLDAALEQVREIKTYTREDGLPTDFYLDLASFGQHLVVNVAPVPHEIVVNESAIHFKPMASMFARRKVLPGYDDEVLAVDSSGVHLHIGEHSRYFPFSLVPMFENAVALSEAKYLFCLENGFALLDKRLLEKSPLKSMASPTVRSIETTSGEYFSANQPLKLKWRHNSLRFRFAAPFFERAPKFSWRLDGFSNGWSPWQSSPEKEFINLPPGRYIFRLRTDTNEQETTLALSIAPPWYRSVWAFAAYFLLAIAAMLGVEKFNRRRLEWQRRRLVAEKQRELQRQRIEAERERLLLEVENKSRELSNAALNLIRKNEVLQRLRDDLMVAKNEPRSMQKIIRLIDQHLEGDHDWEIFEESFNRVHDDFFKRLMHEFPDLTPGDLRLAAYLKMNLSSKEIAPLLNITVRGVENKRYRLRKKIGLAEEANLTEFIMNY